jgi:hypothetical protein
MEELIPASVPPTTLLAKGTKFTHHDALENHECDHDDDDDDDDDDDSSPSILATATLFSRRSVLSSLVVAAVTLDVLPTTHVSSSLTGRLVAHARAPGSTDVRASVQQVLDARSQLKSSLLDHWSDYASIDDEGRARSTDDARRVLGGITPQAGSAAIDAAQNTPLYRLDVAFVSIRKAVLDGDDGTWTDHVDLDRFEELADRITYAVSKADGNFYSVLFAMKGTTMIKDIFVETKTLIQQTIVDLDAMIALLRDAGAPGFVVLEGS